MQKYYILILSLLFPFILSAGNKTDSLLHELDRTIGQSAHYENAKNKKISALKKKFQQRNISPEKQFEINNALFSEYEAYNFDSAMNYINHNLAIASQLDNQILLNESKLKKTRLLSIAGIYVEGMKLIESINKSTLTPEQLQAYYIESLLNDKN